MYIFLISVLLVSFIGLCFFKKKFWENRYLLLLIIAGVSVIATTITNFSTRGNYPIKAEVIREKPLSAMYINDSLLNDGLAIRGDKDFDFDDIPISYQSFIVKTDTLDDSTIKYDTIWKKTKTVFFY